jgi:hypothetical protein
LVKVTVPFEYVEVVVPKRCRKPRRVRFEGKMTVTIREVTSREAPVAIVAHSCLYGVEAFRWYDRRLWVARDQWSRRREPDGVYSYCELDPERAAMSWYDPLRVQRRNVRRWARDRLFVDGVLHRRCGEPRYVVLTFGLGGNHGGTALMDDLSYNSNIGRSRYYPVTRRAGAVAEAERMAMARGDTKSVPIRPHSEFVVLIPEAVRLDPAREHGDGDPFLNKLYGVTEAAGGDAALAGFMAIGVLAGELSGRPGRRGRRGR